MKYVDEKEVVNKLLSTKIKEKITAMNEKITVKSIRRGALNNISIGIWFLMMLWILPDHTKMFFQWMVSFSILIYLITETVELFQKRRNKQ